MTDELVTVDEARRTAEEALKGEGRVGGVVSRHGAAYVFAYHPYAGAAGRSGGTSRTDRRRRIGLERARRTADEPDRRDVLPELTRARRAAQGSPRCTSRGPGNRAA